MDFVDRLRKPVALSFLVGPALLLVGGVFAALEPEDTTWQGVFGQFGGYCFIVSSLAIAWLVGRERPRLGVAAACLGLVGSAAMVQAFAGYFAAGLLGAELGFDARSALAAMSESPSAAQLAGGLVGLTVPLSQIFLGGCLFATGAVSRASASLITLGGVVFVASQAVLNNTGEWISPLLFALGMAPIGFGLWRGSVAWRSDGSA